MKDDIYCWMETINRSEQHRLMAMRVQSGTLVMCMTIAVQSRESASQHLMGKSESSRTHLVCLAPADCYDVQGSDRAEPLVVVRVFANRSGSWASMFAHM